MSVQQDTIGLRAGDVLGARYVVDRALGSGGMGQVYLAHQRPFDRRVVVKVMHPRHATDSQLRQRFVNEARAASQLTHPNTITVYDFGQTDEDVYYIAMEYVDGESLQRVLAREGAFAIERAVPIVVQVAQSLGEAHRKGIIHRDLKLENIMLVRPGGADEFAKVLDFGIAKLVDSGQHLTQTGSVFGTPGYMPPEQARGEVELDATADLYALTCCLYELLTGRMPYEGDSALGVIMKHQTDPVPSLGPSFPARLDAFIARGMAKRPALRPQNADDYIAGLLSCFVDRAPVARAGTPMSGSRTVAGPRTPEPLLRDSVSSSGETLAAGDNPTRPSAPPPVQHPSSGPRSQPRYSPPTGWRAESGSVYDSQTRQAPVAPSSQVPSVAHAGAAPGARRWPMIAAASAVAVAAGAFAWFGRGLLDAPRARGAQAGETGQTERGAPASTATVTVDSDPPQAMVAVDDRRVGTTPTTLALPAHRPVNLRVSKVGYRDEVFSDFRADESPTGKLVVPLQPATVTVQVTSPVAGGELLVDGTSFGSLPAGRSRTFQVQWPSDRLSLVIRYRDYQDYVQKLPASALSKTVDVAPAAADLVAKTHKRAP